MLIVVFVYSSTVLPRVGLTWFDYFFEKLFIAVVLSNIKSSHYLFGLHIIVQARGETR